MFNKGKHERDFTYVDDIVDGIIKIVFSKKNKFGSQIFNIGNGKKIKLLRYIQLIEKNLKKKALKKFLPLQKGDVFKTHSDIRLIKKYYNYNPKTDVNHGVKKFIEWYISNIK